MWCMLEQALPLDERLTDQTEITMFEVAQTAVDEAAGPGRNAAADIVLLDQNHPKAAQRRVNDVYGQSPRNY